VGKIAPPGMPVYGAVTINQSKPYSAASAHDRAMALHSVTFAGRGA